MEWTPCSIAPDICVRCDRDGLFVAAIKSSTKTSTRFVYVNSDISLCCGISILSDIICSSKGFYGRFISCNSVSMTYLDVSDTAQKNGSDSHHPICKQFGTNTLMYSMFSTWLDCGST